MTSIARVFITTLFVRSRAARHLPWRPYCSEPSSFSRCDAHPNDAHVVPRREVAIGGEASGSRWTKRTANDPLSSQCTNWPPTRGREGPQVARRLQCANWGVGPLALCPG